MNKENNFTLSSAELYRYSRQIVLPGIGIEGQQRLKKSSVLIVGLGGLGSVQALYLAAAGIGRIGLIDEDVIDISNIQRQVSYSTGDTGSSKVLVTKKKLLDINPLINTDTFPELLTAQNAERIISKYDIVIDGSDNFATRYLTNDICVFQKKPVIYGSVYRYDGQISVFDSTRGPCYRCLYPEPPSPGEATNCIIGGVLGTLPGLVGQMQATEAIKMICGIDSILCGYLLLFNIRGWNFNKIKIPKNPECVVCSENPVITAPVNYEQFCGTEEIDLPEDWQITAAELNRCITAEQNIRMIDIREPQESMICSILGAELIPEKEFIKQAEGLDKKGQIVLLCRSGIRSARLVAQFREQGFSRIRNLQGGILAWIDEVDDSLAKY